MTQHTELIAWLRTIRSPYAGASANALEAQAREIEKLRKDAERFLALERIVHWEQERDMGPGGRYWMAVHVSSGNPTLREAIDAMKAQP